MKKKEITHHWRWRTPKYLITCGVNGLIRRDNIVNCRNCIRVAKSRGWNIKEDGKSDE